jgi:uncharacterized protein YdaU (DUF1376 family)
VSRTDTWMPFYVGDYLSATGRLTTEQHGAYLLLLLDYWKNGPPPNNDAVLAQIARMSAKAWSKAKPVLLSFFEERDGHLIQNRVERERERVAEVVEKRSKAGKASAAARAKTQQNGNTCSTHVETNGHQNGRQIQSQLHSSTELIASSNEDVSAEPTEEPLTVEEVVEAWNDTAKRLGLVQVKKLTRERQQKTQARIRENTIADFKAALSTIEQSPFLRGEGRNGWKADFDFFVQKSSFTKLVEGSYVH